MRTFCFNMKHIFRKPLREKRTSRKIEIEPADLWEEVHERAKGRARRKYTATFADGLSVLP
jgi:hypothetical protein